MNQPIMRQNARQDVVETGVKWDIFVNQMTFSVYPCPESPFLQLKQRLLARPVPNWTPRSSLDSLAMIKRSSIIQPTCLPHSADYEFRLISTGDFGRNTTICAI